VRGISGFERSSIRSEKRQRSARKQGASQSHSLRHNSLVLRRLRSSRVFRGLLAIGLQLCYSWLKNPIFKPACQDSQRSSPIRIRVAMVFSGRFQFQSVF